MDCRHALWQFPSGIARKKKKKNCRKIIKPFSFRFPFLSFGLITRFFFFLIFLISGHLSLWRKNSHRFDSSVKNSLFCRRINSSPTTQHSRTLPNLISFICVLLVYKVTSFQRLIGSCGNLCIWVLFVSSRKCLLLRFGLIYRNLSE